jgi:uncharacterized protein
VKSPREFVDYSHETKVSRNPLLRYLWLSLGLIATGLGFLGYILPGLPGTVFILVAVYFFARSSPRFYNWLLNNRIFGGFIRDWRAGKGLSLKAKLTAITVIAVTITLSVMLIENQILKIIVVFCGIGVSLYLWTRPTKVTKS